MYVSPPAVFQDQPKLPPSPAQAALREAEPEHYLASILRLVKNPYYLLLLVTYGMNVGVFYAISTLLNQVVLTYYPVSARSLRCNQRALACELTAMPVEVEHFGISVIF